MSRRDLWLLPLLSLLTVLVMLGTSEVTARVLWPAEDRDACQVITGDGFSYRGHCRSRVKAAEGPWVDNAYNDCGYRSAEPCAPEHPGVTRVVTIGSSISFGYNVPYDQAYPALTSAALTRQCARPVEFQNTGAPLRNMLTTYRHLDEALALQPDLVIFTVDPYDVQVNEMRPELAATLETPYVPSAAPRAPQGPGLLRKYLVTPLKESRAVLALQHQLYTDPATFLKLYLLYGDAGSGYLKRTLSPAWQSNFRNFDLIVAAMARKTQARHVPLVILVTPSAAQVALQHTLVPDGLDAESFAHQVRTIAAAHGVEFVDSLPAMADGENPMGLFYIVDGHAGPVGQARIARALDEALRSDRFPPFADCQRQNAL